MVSIKATYLSMSGVMIVITGHVHHQKGEDDEIRSHLTITSFHLYLFLAMCCSRKKHSVPVSVNLIPQRQLFLLSHIIELAN